MDAMDFAGTDSTGNDDLKAFRPFLPLKLVNCFGCRHAFVGAPVMADPDRFVIWHTEMERRHLNMPALPQFAEPLMGDVKAARKGHGKDALRMIVLRAQARDSFLQNFIHFLFRREMDKRHHTRFDAQPIALPHPREQQDASRPGEHRNCYLRERQGSTY